jgi:hypothetical protein
VTIQHGIINIQFPIDKSDQAKEWINKLYINILSIIIYKAKLTAFVNFHITDTQLKDHEIDSLRKHKRKKKQRSKKIIKLKIIDSDTINKHYDQLKAAEEKKLAKKKKLANKKKRKSDNKRERKLRGDGSNYHYLVKMMMINRIIISNCLSRNQLRRKGRLYGRMMVWMNCH